MTLTVKEKKDVEIEISEAWCKGCVICVDYCPHDVLIMERGKAKVANLAACTACMLCELHCPDFAIVVRDKSKE
ncbi:MAG: tungsten formylmethanofuran dehydrogenase [Calditrichaeota bacterium]|nr:tungsten formylmethanofuran dehydrogenase [Calditrichota bacterium]